VIPFYYGSGTVINYRSGSDFLARYGSGSGSASQKVTVPTVPVPQRWCKAASFFASTLREQLFKFKNEVAIKKSENLRDTCDC
jgi:hypothetical protein